MRQLPNDPRDFQLLQRSFARTIVSPLLPILADCGLISLLRGPLRAPMGAGILGPLQDPEVIEDGFGLYLNFIGDSLGSQSLIPEDRNGLT